MKYLRFYSIGVLFGIIMTKAEVISWYRIVEMFMFKSFHMYGIIGSAIVLGVIGVQIIKRNKFKSIEGSQILFHSKEKSWKRYLYGGIIFGLGWALTGACPGPMFTLVGNGVFVMLVVILAAMFGTFAYGLIRKKLPH